IGAGSVVVRSVPANTTVVGIPGRVVVSHGQRLTAEEELEHGHLPDPEAQAIKCLGDKIRELEKRIDELTKKEGAKESTPPLRLVAEEDSKTCEVEVASEREI
ncbi:MAG: hypothetical protein QME63_10335, partial [Actinomycetota bacterium]|nr:hypothetical protein [Actinomycetota bacterium]